MAITKLGHTGLWVYDLPTMRDFYERLLGLTVTDEDEEHGIVFFSSQPDKEHHEFVLQVGRTSAIGDKQQHQISWRVESLEDIRRFHDAFVAEGVEVQQEVTHGNAFGIYFFDPEGNRNEVYLRVERDVRQPFRKSIDFGMEPDEIWAEAERLLGEDGERYRPAR
jgi:catechol 2,3-dioxygenase-like lactoylglutathione lyase family enzyme